MNPVILEADQPHFDKKIKDAINYLGDLGEYYNKKFKQGNKYAKKAESARNDIANAWGLMLERVKYLEDKVNRAYERGYIAAQEEAEQHPDRQNRLKYKTKVYKLLKKFGHLELVQNEQGENVGIKRVGALALNRRQRAEREAKRILTIKQAQKKYNF